MVTVEEPMKWLADSVERYQRWNGKKADEVKQEIVVAAESVDEAELLLRCGRNGLASKV